MPNFFKGARALRGLGEEELEDSTGSMHLRSFRASQFVGGH